MVERRKVQEGNEDSLRSRTTPMPLPDTFNAATYFVDRHLTEGRGGAIAIECGDEQVTYLQVAERANRLGAALRGLGLQPEQRVALLLLDSPAFAYSFFGAIKAGLVPVPLNTMWRARDYRTPLATVPRACSSSARRCWASSRPSTGRRCLDLNM